jgi:hypothetical protein
MFYQILYVEYRTEEQPKREEYSLLERDVWYKFTDVSEDCTASVFRVEENDKQATSKKHEAERETYSSQHGVILLKIALLVTAVVSSYSADRSLFSFIPTSKS